MNDKYAKEIAKELRLIRIELQKISSPKTSEITIDGVPDVDVTKLSEVFAERAGERVTIK